MRTPGIETEYGGVRFRSCLEAKWARLFDTISWRWEYEPFDCAGYIPDFEILGDAPLLVEVRPDCTVTDLRRHVEQVERCLETWQHDILLLGSTPILDQAGAWHGQHPTMGLLGDACWRGNGSALDFERGLWNVCGECGAAAVFHEYGSFQCRPCGHHDGDHYLTGPVPNVNAAWTSAVNATRWTPR